MTDVQTIAVSEDQPFTEEGEYSEEKLRRFRRFARRVLIIFAVAHVYVGFSLLADFPLNPWLAALGWLWLALSAVLIPYGTLARLFFKNPTMVDRLVWAGSLAMGWFSSVLVFTVFRDVVLWVPGTESWTEPSAFWVLALSVFTTSVGFVNARRTARVVDVDIPLENLPSGLDGLSIVQISDIHVGSTIKADYVRNIVDKVNTLGADIIAITGDVVDGKLRDLAADVQPLGSLKARYGVYVVTGNHDLYSGADAWMDYLRTLGLTPLRNEHRVIDHEDARLVLAGVEDYGASNMDPERGSDPKQALLGSPEGLPRILLAHQPRSAEAADKAGFDLQLSGHTHGGQFWPWNHFVKFQQPFTAGLHRFGKMWVYTSQGTGYWGPPKRLFAPSEITLIRLRKAA